MPAPPAMRIDIDTALNALFDRRSKNLHKVEMQKNFSVTSVDSIYPEPDSCELSYGGSMLSEQIFVKAI